LGSTRKALARRRIERRWGWVYIDVEYVARTVGTIWSNNGECQLLSKESRQETTTYEPSVVASRPEILRQCLAFRSSCVRKVDEEQRQFEENIGKIFEK